MLCEPVHHAYPSHRDAGDRFPDLRLHALPRRRRGGHATPAASASWARWRTRPEQLDVDLKWIREQTKGRPFGVDLLIPRKYVGRRTEGGLDRGEPASACCPTSTAQWIDELLARYDVPALPAADGQRPRRARHGAHARRPEEHGAADRRRRSQHKRGADRLGARHAAGAGWSSGRTPAGIPVAALAGRIDHAVAHQEAGVDLVIAQGTEGGGHTGEIATMVLVPQVVDAVAPTPVLAAGGIATGRQVAASLALGAEGVWCGSVWLTTHEAETVAGGAGEVPRRQPRATRGARARSPASRRACCAAPWTDAWEAARRAAAAADAAAEHAGRRRAAPHPPRRAQGRTRARASSSTYFVGQVVGQMNVAKSDARAWCARWSRSSSR